MTLPLLLAAMCSAPLAAQPQPPGKLVPEILRQPVKEPKSDADRAAAIATLTTGSRDKVAEIIFYGKFDPADDKDRKALTAALDSTDRRTRQLAMCILCSWGTAEPTKRMLEVCYEGLEDDAIPLDKTRPKNARVIAPVGNACDATEYLVAHAEPAKLLIQRGLTSKDEQQKLLCAFIAGRANMTRLAPLAIPILLEHLRDNEIRGDAVTAFNGLRGFGKAALPHFDSVARPDEQQRVAMSILKLAAEAANDDAFVTSLRSLPATDRALATTLVGHQVTRPALIWSRKDFDERREIYSPKNAPAEDAPADPPPAKNDKGRG